MKLKLKAGLDGVRLRETPVDGKPIGQVHIGDVLETLESPEETHRKLAGHGAWLHVQTREGVSAFIAAWFLDVITEEEDSSLGISSTPNIAETATVPVTVVEDATAQPLIPATAVNVGGIWYIAVHPSGDGLHIRSTPETGEIITACNRDTVLIAFEDPASVRERLGKQDSWIRVRTLFGRVGYAAAWFLEPYVGPIPDVGVLPEALNITGMNLDQLHPLGMPDAEELDGLGWIRLVYNVSAAMGSQDLEAAYDRYAPHLERYTRAGLNVLLCFTHQTYGEGRNEFWPWEAMDTEKWRLLSGRYSEMLNQIARKFKGSGLTHAYQIWNEQDAQIGAEASVAMTPQDYAILLGGAIQAIKAVDPIVPVITGGHMSGPGPGSQYASQTIAALPDGVLPDGIAFHPYGRGVEGPMEPYAIHGRIDDSFDAYGKILPDCPLWITEWGVLQRPNDDPIQILDYATALVEYIKRHYSGRLAAMIWYAWAMSMHTGYGLVNQQNLPINPLYDGFRRL